MQAVAQQSVQGSVLQHALQPSVGSSTGNGGLEHRQKHNLKHTYVPQLRLNLRSIRQAWACTTRCLTWPRPRWTGCRCTSRRRCRGTRRASGRGRRRRGGWASTGSTTGKRRTTTTPKITTTTTIGWAEARMRSFPSLRATTRLDSRTPRNMERLLPQPQIQVKIPIILLYIFVIANNHGFYRGG